MGTPSLDPAQVARELPSREELWRELRDEFHGLRNITGGFVGTSRHGDKLLRVLLTPEVWQEFVVSCEIACRTDEGVDADRPGSGPMVAIERLDETLATLDGDETYVVLDGYDFTGSTRAELPPVRGTAGAREAERIRSRGGGRWSVVDRDGTVHYFDERPQD